MDEEGEEEDDEEEVNGKVQAELAKPSDKPSSVSVVVASNGDTQESGPLPPRPPQQSRSKVSSKNSAGISYMPLPPPR
ncbi:unnamed protein product [Dibothriocephalus latus]|uniref:Uncharacterized protein n=1 Tax=Dibothriocephalus latus TaxID=60516 RepID=A0A3P7RH94_DIBLA|nr:unnamed protein product [Dibothriocephalus latus]